MFLTRVKETRGCHILFAKDPVFLKLFQTDSVKIFLTIPKLDTFDPDKTLAGIAGALLFHLLKEKTKFLKINGSNSVSSGVDSMIFPTLVFGQLMPVIVIGQFLAKVLGGAVWFFIISALKSRFVFNQSRQ